MKLSSITALTVLLLCACTATPAPSAPAASAGPSAEMRPDRKKTVAHLHEHVHYPAPRSQVLAACADTPEFTEAEKSWFATHLPERSYASAEEVVQALPL